MTYRGEPELRQIVEKQMSAKSRVMYDGHRQCFEYLEFSDAVAIAVRMIHEYQIHAFNAGRKEPS